MNVKLSNGVNMPKIGLGTFRVEAGESAYQTVLNALETGYRHIDTAQLYYNESDIGNAVVDSKIKRSDIFITTKQMPHHHGDIDLIMADIDESLKKLKTDYVDLLLIHWPNHDDEINHKVWQALELAYKQKKARAIGVSNFQKHHLSALLERCEIKPMVNQIELHPGLNQLPLEKYMNSKDIKVISYGPFMKGKIYEEPYLTPLKTIADKYAVSVAQLVIAWGLNRGIFMIPKSVNPQRLKENFAAKDLKIEESDIKLINDLSRGNRVYTDPDNNPFNN